MTGVLEAEKESNKSQREEDNGLTEKGRNADADYVIDKIVDHGFQEEKPILKMR